MTEALKRPRSPLTLPVTTLTPWSACVAEATLRRAMAVHFRFPTTRLQSQLTLQPQNSGDHHADAAVDACDDAPSGTKPTNQGVLRDSPDVLAAAAYVARLASQTTVNVPPHHVSFTCASTSAGVARELARYVENAEQQRVANRREASDCRFQVTKQVCRQVMNAWWTKRADVCKSRLEQFRQDVKRQREHEAKQVDLVAESEAIMRRLVDTLVASHISNRDDAAREPPCVGGSQLSGLASTVPRGKGKGRGAKSSENLLRSKLMSSLANVTAVSQDPIGQDEPAGPPASSSAASSTPLPPLDLLDTDHGKRDLRPYQTAGLVWLVNQYSHHFNAILADEMGLGKTVQTLALFAYYAQHRRDWGPHLIVVPTTVVLNWEMECRRWVPGMSVVAYLGSVKERKKLRVGWLSGAVNIVIASYNTVLADRAVFRNKVWGFLVLDEAHMVKNAETQRFQGLFDLQAEHRLLLTGTPLQNSVMELWALLRFIMPGATAFEQSAEFRTWFADPMIGIVSGGQRLNASLVSRLHALLRPFMLRRLKRDVEAQLPSKTEVIVECGMSVRQADMYRDTMKRAEEAWSQQLRRGGGGGLSSSPMAWLLTLRKVCNHPNMVIEPPVRAPLDLVMFDVTLTVPACVVQVPYVSTATTSGAANSPGWVDVGTVKRVWNSIGAPASLDRSTARSFDGSAGAAWWSLMMDPCHVRFVRRPDDAGGEEEARLRYLDWQRKRAIPFPKQAIRSSTPSHCGKTSLPGTKRTDQKGMPPADGQPAKKDRSARTLAVSSVALPSPVDRPARPPPPPSSKPTSLDQVGGLSHSLITPLARAVCFVDCAHSVPRHSTAERWLVPTITQRYDALRDTLLMFACYIGVVRMRRPPVVVLSSPAPLAATSSGGRVGNLWDVDPSPSLADRLYGWTRRRLTVETTSREARIEVQLRLFPSWEFVTATTLQFPRVSQLIPDSGKLLLTVTLLKRLRYEGHRALIFTQFVNMLDILERALALSGITYLRLDGSTAPVMRQQHGERFNRDPRVTAMLLSTRAGGIGLNLIGADTVIFYDADWNPAMDLQAQDRCHRIGQTRPVTVYRLITTNSVEAGILRTARQRKKLNNLVIRGGRFDRIAGMITTTVGDESAGSWLGSSGAPGGLGVMQLLRYFHDFDEHVTVDVQEGSGAEDRDDAVSPLLEDEATGDLGTTSAAGSGRLRGTTMHAAEDGDDRFDDDGPPDHPVTSTNNARRLPPPAFIQGDVKGNDGQSTFQRSVEAQHYINRCYRQSADQERRDSVVLLRRVVNSLVGSEAEKAAALNFVCDGYALDI